MAEKRFPKYKLSVDYREWVKTHNSDEIYAITSAEGDHLFDVCEEDFIEMADLGLVTTDGFYDVTNNPSESVLAKYAEKWGIYWTDKEVVGHVIVIDASTGELLVIEVTKEQADSIENDYDDSVEAWISDNVKPKELRINMSDCSFMYIEGKPNVHLLSLLPNGATITLPLKLTLR